MQTFKQFLEADEARQIYAKKIEGAQPWTPALSEGNYKVGDITFSAKDGLGSVPNNQSVNYMGFVALCRPSVFLRLALDHAGERDETAADIKRLVGEGYAVGIPWLVVNTRDLEEEKGPAKITGHEGRARMLAVKGLNGDDAIPIHCFFTGGTRAHHMTPELIRDLQLEITVEGGTHAIPHPFKAVYFNGKAV
jgi:hypothetical protein